MQTLEYSNKFRETNSTPKVATIDIRIQLTVDANQTLDRSSTLGHDEPRSEDGDSNEESGVAHPGNNPDHAPNHDPEESAR